MRTRRLAATVLLSVGILAALTSSVAADENDRRSNASVEAIPNGVVLTVTQAGSSVTGPGAPAWLSKCQWYTTTRTGVDFAYASYQGHAYRDRQHFIDEGLDPDEEFVMVQCQRSPDVLAAAPVVGLTGFLGAWPVAGPPPQVVLDWLVARTRAQLSVPVQIGDSAPSGDLDHPWLTQVETWLWVDDSVWQPVSVRSDSLFGTFVTVTATPYWVEFEDDDDHYVDCLNNIGTPWNDAMSDDAQTACAITPEHSSRTGDRALTSRIHWAVTYQCNRYCGSGVLDDYVVQNTRPVVTNEYLVVES